MKLTCNYLISGKLWPTQWRSWCYASFSLVRGSRLLRAKINIDCSGINEYRGRLVLTCRCPHKSTRESLSHLPPPMQCRRRGDQISTTNRRSIHETIQSSNCGRGGCRDFVRILCRANLRREHVAQSRRLPADHG